MDLVSFILTLPLAPVRGVAALAEVLLDEAERELYDPAKLRARIEEIEALVSSGEMSQDEGEQRQQEILEHLLVVPADSIDK